MSVTQTSLMAYLDGLKTLAPKQEMVLKVISRYVGICDQEIQKELGWPINTITNRRGELVDKGLIELAYEGKYEPTNKKVKFWKIKERKLENTLMQFAEVE